MSYQVTTYQVQQYTTNVEMLLQQMGGKLRDCVIVREQQGKAATWVEQVGQVKPVKNQSRHSDTPLISTPADRRWIYPNDYEWADLIDEQDRLRLFAELDSPYVANGVNALRRAQDDEILQAFYRGANTGENGSTSTVFLAANQIAANYGAAANVGLTVAKLRKAKQLLIASGMDIRAEELYCAISSFDHDGLLAETQVINRDYNPGVDGVPVLVDGIVTKFLGINFVLVEFTDTIYDASATLFTGGIRYVPLWCKSGMALGMWNDVQSFVDQRPDKRYSTQVYVRGTFGSTRVQEKKVVQIATV